MNLNLNVRGLPNSATVAINERCNQLIADGRQVYKLGLGQSPFPVPESVVEALRQNAHQKDYLPVKGLRALREAVAGYHSRRADIVRTGDDVLIGPGSKELMFLLQMVFYGDLVIPTPAWVSYAPQARIIGRQVRMVQTLRENDWHLQPERLAELCAEDPSRPRILILNYPANPTGRSYSRAELEALADVAMANNVVLLSDEIYGELHHEGNHASIAPFYPEGTIISSGLSKWCGAGGWRLGTFLFPKRMRWLLDAMASAASETFTSTSAPIQHAAIRAFEGGPDIERYLLDERRVLAGLGRWSALALQAAGAHCPAPHGAFYLFPDFEAHREALAARGILDAPALCERLLEDTGVAILPGVEFGRPRTELTARLAYVNFDGEAALAELAAQDDPSAPVDEDFLRRRCGETLTAIERICEWVQG
ncbi:aminotransferase class I/II-fold pyridoxal phosphate-dependent enzyme [Pseudenhygromyxa sp. WMMC2535]|nr:aminotransferase class I/II-fold pyridoxal phosphate-dependent enzyme [Pseudenhygromyxa sp. WMMC2535]